MATAAEIDVKQAIQIAARRARGEKIEGSHLYA